MSVFLHLSEKQMFDRARNLVSGSTMLECVQHARAPRAARSNLGSELSPCLLRIGRPRQDGEPGTGTGRDGSKLGGSPFVFQPDSASKRFAALQKGGLVHVAQLCFAVGANEFAVSGPWPFADGQINIFGRSPFGPDDWCFYWWY